MNDPELKVKNTHKLPLFSRVSHPNYQLFPFSTWTIAIYELKYTSTISSLFLPLFLPDSWGMFQYIDDDSSGRKREQQIVGLWNSLKNDSPGVFFIINSKIKDTISSTISRNIQEVFVCVSSNSLDFEGMYLEIGYVSTRFARHIYPLLIKTRNNK